MIIETKFNIRDEVWFLRDNKPFKSQVQNINISIKRKASEKPSNEDSCIILVTPFNLTSISEERCFSTKEELIEEKLKEWEKIK